MDNNLARAMAALTTGIYVLTTHENGRCHGMSSSWVAQVSGEPVMFTAALEARVIDSHVAGDHTIFVASPVNVRVSANDRPLTSLDLDYVYLGGKNVVSRDRSGWD
jgi:flavin reductase (DIM6/NTAB) family NADH-FMN oxidoreductase RutF